MTTNLYRFLKHCTTLLILMLLVTNCERDHNINEQTTVQDQVSHDFKNKFNADDFRDIIRYQYTVDWSTPKKEYSDQLNSYFYEFPIVYSNAFNPDVFSKQVKRPFKEKYKVVAVENDDKEFEFFIAKYSLRNTENIPYNSLSILKNFGYDGTLNMYNKNAEMTFAKHISKEKELDDFYSKSKDLQKRDWVTVCTTTTIYHYRDWYRVVYDWYGNIISSTYLYTTFEGTSQEKRCHQKWIPDPVRPNTSTCKYEIIDGICPQKFDDIKPVVMCPEGFEDNGFGKCVEIEMLHDDRLAFDDEIINNLTGKAKCVYDKLNSMSTGFKNMIKKFDGDFPVSHLKLELKDLGTTRGQTIAPDGTGNSPDYVITIQLNSNSNIHGINYRPNLMTAKTIAHEVIHAEMFRKLLSVLDNGGNIAGITRQNVLDALGNNYPGMYDYYRRYRNWQHQQMATHYRGTIADVLKVYDNNQHSYQFYMDLAWEGLKYPNISTWSSQSQAEKDRINKVISDYIDANKNENCL